LSSHTFSKVSMTRSNTRRSISSTEHKRNKTAANHPNKTKKTKRTTKNTNDRLHFCKELVWLIWFGLGGFI
jgi:hypothetical protein